MWGGRFNADGDPLFKAINDSLSFDAALVQEDIEGSRAWAKGLREVGVLSEAELLTLDETLLELAALARTDPRAVHEAGEEDVHTWVETRLVERIGDLGKKLHTGRSRNDQVATDLRLWTRRQIAHRRQELRAVQSALIDLARREEATIMPGYTHLQRAQPILFSHWCLAYVEMLERDGGRFTDAARRADRCPLGAGALAGTAYPIDRAAIAKHLGFGAPTENSLDAVSDRDFVFETLAASALCGLHLSRLAEDLVFFASGEAGFVEMDDAVTSGSSIMPQKKNPDALELVRGKSGRLVGALVSIATTLKGLPLAYNKDLQEDKEPLFDAMEHLARCLRIVPLVLDRLRVNRAVARRAAQGGYSNATEMADYLVAKGVPFREAHAQVGRVVRHAIERDLPLEDLPLADLQAHAPNVDEDVRAHLSVESTLGKRDVHGGTAPQRVRDAIARASARLDGAAAPAPGALEVRDARIDDVDGICRLVDYWYEQGENLPRSREDVVEAIRDFTVAVVDGTVVGCGCLHLYSTVLAEVRSIGVDPAHHGKGIGSRIARHLIKRAEALHLPNVFVLTRALPFFERLGFETVAVETMPEKIWKDCTNCPRRECCDETAMIKPLTAASAPFVPAMTGATTG